MSQLFHESMTILISNRRKQLVFPLWTFPAFRQMLQVFREHGFLVPAGLLELFHGETLGVMEVSPMESRIVEIGIAEIGLLKIGTAEVGMLKNGRAEVGLLKISLAETGPCEDSLEEIRLDEIS